MTTYTPCERIRQHNAPLRESMFDSGHAWKNNAHTAHFVNAAGEYVPFPATYITGPVWGGGNGTPNPWYCSVMLHNGSWAQRSFDTSDKAALWAIEYVESMNPVSA